jgi:hypothetical protein
LRARIGGELSKGALEPLAYSGRIERPTRRSLFYVLMRDFGWACAGAAAALAVLALLPGRHTTPAPTNTASEPVATAATTNAFEHDETTHELVSTQGSDELVETDDGPAREVRYTYLERHEWSNPHTGARVYLEVPREDVYLLPVSLQ